MAAAKQSNKDSGAIRVSQRVPLRIAPLALPHRLKTAVAPANHSARKAKFI
jgi:hypothetical protein